MDPVDELVKPPSEVVSKRTVACATAGSAPNVMRVAARVAAWVRFVFMGAMSCVCRASVHPLLTRILDGLELVELGQTTQYLGELKYQSELSD